jgi:hypothetical protein
MKTKLDKIKEEKLRLHLDEMLCDDISAGIRREFEYAYLIAWEDCQAETEKYVKDLLKVVKELIVAHKNADETFYDMGGDHQIRVDELIEITKPIRQALAVLRDYTYGAESTEQVTEGLEEEG